MTKKQVWQYRCGFCKKRGLSSGHMSRHETGCTANPDRRCKMHKYFEKPQLPMTDLLRAICTTVPDCGMARLRELAGNCPMCILAAVRQSGINKWDGDPASQSRDLGFDFKVELKAKWEQVNADCVEVEFEGGYL